MRSKCRVTFGTYNNTELYVLYDKTQLVFLMRPMWASILLGWLGEKMVPPTKELFRIATTEITSITVVSMEQLTSTYELTLKNGTVCRLSFKKGDELAAQIVDDLKSKLQFDK